MRTFTFADGKSDKFWNIELSGKSFTVTFGRTGSKGQAQTKTFADAATAEKEHDKLVNEKLRKGYVETNVVAVPAVPDSLERRALEKSLVEHPDELATHSAYADYLTEQGDPRGEFIQTQLALEDESRSKAERDALRKKEAALRKKHAREWLGDAGRFLVGDWSGTGKPYSCTFSRGWLDFVRVLPIPEEVVAAIARSPEARMLRHLEVVYDMHYHPFDFTQFTNGLKSRLREGERNTEDDYEATPTLPDLVESPYLTNLRVLKYGFSDDPSRPRHSTMVAPFGDAAAAQVVDILKKCPRLEELYLNTDVRRIDDLFAAPQLGQVRLLQHYYGSRYRHYEEPRADPYPLSTLAQNKALKNLTTLRLHPGRDTTIALDEFDALVRSKKLPALVHLQVHMTTATDEFADRVVRSGILKRLKTLDLGYGNMTDDGARVLAACADAKKLEVLDLSQNALTAAGVKALRDAGVRVVADDQHDADNDEYLYSVDVE